MAGKVKPIPEGHHTVTPYLAIKNAAKALEFYAKAFDAVETYRLTLPDGRVVDGLPGVQALLLAKPELFVSALTEKLTMYALGRNVQYYDAPAIRAVVHGAAAKNYAFSAIVEGIVASVPFQMRTAQAAADQAGEPTVAAATEAGGEL